MTTRNAPAEPAVTNETTLASPSAAALPSWPWRRAALLLAGAAQLITISALNGSYPLAVTWSSLLLAIAPAPLAAVAAFAPARIGLAAAVAGVVILVAGMAGGIGLVGVFFIPAAVVLAVAAVKLWRERP